MVGEGKELVLFETETEAEGAKAGAPVQPVDLSDAKAAAAAL